MKRNDLVTLNEACDLLQISRPTFNNFRKKYSLEEKREGRKIFFSKLELIEKIIYQSSRSINLQLNALEDSSLLPLFIQDSILDLRGDINMDALGVISLLSTLKDLIKNQDKNVYILVSNNFFCRYLKSIGFFRELERSNLGKVFYKDEIIDFDPNMAKDSLILPLHIIGYRGAEKGLLEPLLESLKNQGFSQEISSYLAWVLGELSDNVHTHAKGGPCYLMIESMHNPQIKFKFLSLVIGDVGLGIPTTLKTNSKYSLMTEEVAFVSSFLSFVSSWPDEHKRGKGLNDILAIAMGNRSWLRIESNNLALRINFRESERTIKWIKPISPARGTRVSLILIDSEFKIISRADVDGFIKKFLGK